MRENSIVKITRILKEFGIPTGRINYKGDADGYTVYRMLEAEPAMYADDDFNNLIFTFEIHLLSKKDYTETLQNLVTALRNESYTIVNIGAEVFYTDTSFFDIPIIIKESEEL